MRSYVSVYIEVERVTYRDRSFIAFGLDADPNGGTGPMGAVLSYNRIISAGLEACPMRDGFQVPIVVEGAVLLVLIFKTEPEARECWATLSERIEACAER